MIMMLCNQGGAAEKKQRPFEQQSFYPGRIVVKFIQSLTIPDSSLNETSTFDSLFGSIIDAQQIISAERLITSAKSLPAGLEDFLKNVYIVNLQDSVDIFNLV